MSSESRRSSKSSKRGKRARRGSKGSAARAGGGQAREFSAGGVVVRGGEVAVIVPTRRAADGSRVLALPKGHVDPGETPIEAATREVREETGIVAEPVGELGESRYWYRRDGRTIGKTVAFFLFDYLEGDTADHDDEVEEVRWIGLQQARTALSHAAEREMVELALARLSKEL
jgi:8-oxo-dGTP pyrophosphatase MutT (NUDIX family)